MSVPVQVTFRDIPPSEALENKIRERAAKLERFFDRITRCQVVVEELEHSHQTGNLYNVRVEIGIPTREPVVVNRTPPARSSHQDAYIAVRDAFDAAERKLESMSRRMKGHVKTHQAPPHGRVLRVDHLEHHGFLETPDGLEVYFHENAIINGKLADLSRGSEVRFTLVEGEGLKGPQASTVQAVGKHHVVP